MHRKFDTTKLVLADLQERKSEIDLSAMLPLCYRTEVHPSIEKVAKCIRNAKDSGASVVLMMGAHVIRSGVQAFIIDMMEKGYISCLAGNGACAIHDFEFAMIGQTTESVAKYIRDGRFGLWRQTGKLNDIIVRGALQGLGAGEVLGREILEGEYPHKDVSLFAAAQRLGIPFTVHASLGYDIVHQHPNCDGAAWGHASYTDFLYFAAVLERLEGGVVMNFGSAVMGPEVYLKALSMVRNVARQEGREIKRFTTMVSDLHELPDSIHKEAPRSNVQYFYRPWKTMLLRTVADGGDSYYVKMQHADSIPQLWSFLGSPDGGKL